MSHVANVMHTNSTMITYSIMRCIFMSSISKILVKYNRKKRNTHTRKEHSNKSFKYSNKFTDKIWSLAANFTEPILDKLKSKVFHFLV